jgi:hypothetical protein
MSDLEKIEIIKNGFSIGDSLRKKHEGKEKIIRKNY